MVWNISNTPKSQEKNIMNPGELIIQFQQFRTFYQSNFISSSTPLPFFFLDYFKANSRYHVISLM